MKKLLAKIRNIKNKKWYFVTVINELSNEIAVRENLEDENPLLMDLKDFDPKSLHYPEQE